MHGRRGAAQPRAHGHAIRPRRAWRRSNWATARSASRRENAKGERDPTGRRASRAEIGHAAKAGLAAPPLVLRSVRLDDAPGKKPEIPSYKVGDIGRRRHLRRGDTVKVTGTSKGRGFQGVVKRHGFGGGPNTHGNTKHRRPGSIGPGTDPSRVIKGKKMPGHYGAEQHTQTHLRVERIDAERHLLYIRGSVAGPEERDRRRAQAGMRTPWPMTRTTGHDADPHDVRCGDVHRAGHAARRPCAFPASCSTARSTCP